MSTLKDQVLALSTALKTLPSETVVKLMLVISKPLLLNWQQQVNTHHDAMMRYPDGSTMRKAAEKKYEEAFANWHRMSFFVLKIEEAVSFKGLGVVSPKVRLGAPVEPAQQAA